MVEQINVIIYSRVSTTDQNVAQQIDYLRKWCANQGYNIVKVVADKESGTLPLAQRKQFKKILANTGDAEAIVVYKLDRLTRNWEDTILIETHFKRNWDTCRLISACEPVELGTAAGRFNYRVLMALNCYMPEDMLEKQRIGIARAKAQGKYKGRPKGSKNK